MSDIYRYNVEKLSNGRSRPIFPEQVGTVACGGCFAATFPEQVGTVGKLDCLAARLFRSIQGQNMLVFCDYCVQIINVHNNMAGKTTSMSKIKQALLLRQQHYSLRKISELLGIGKNTINEYLHVIKRNGYKIDELLGLPDIEFDAKFRPGNPAYTDKRMETFLSELPHYRESLTKRHVTRTLVWEEYRHRHPDGYGKSQFYYHLKQNLVAEKSQTAVLSGTYNPGERLFVDFAGAKLYYIDEDTGERQPQGCRDKSGPV